MTTTAKDKLRFTTTLLAYSAAVAAMTASCEQEPITCNTAHGSFAVKFTLMSGTGECAMLSGGIVGVQPYVRGGQGMQPRYDNVPVALKTEEMGALVAEYGEMGQTIDASGQLITGEPFHDIRDLKRILKERHRLDFYRCLT